MLTREQAQEQLSAQRTKDWQSAVRKRAAKLPRASRDLCEAVLHYQGDVWGYGSRGKQDPWLRVVDLKDEDRPAILEALFPKIYTYVEAGWQLHMRLPYQTGYSRKAFRAPRTPETHRYARARWFH